MPCPNCDHTMHTVSRGDFWCPHWRQLGIAESINKPEEREIT